MNILLSSYSINPYKGSEDAVGWNWLLQVAKHYNKPNDKIYVVTKKFNEKDTVNGIKELRLNNVELIIVDVPNHLNWFREKHSMFHHMYYILWQNEAYKWAKKSKIKFDVIHHVTMGNYRITGNMCKFKKAYTIFGPVGGGQVTPPSLKCYYKTQKIYENYRELINKIFMYFPSYKRKLKKFNSIYAVNKETQKIIEKISGRNCNLLPEIAVSKELQNLEISKVPSNEVKLIYVGRLIELKGIMFLIDVIKEIKTLKKFKLTLYGSGELENDIRKKIKQYSLEDRIELYGEFEHTKISQIYREADIFVHPTFRDSGGAVFIEAMSHKLPIVALNQSLSRDLNEHGCGLFVNVDQSKDEIVKEFANNITTLIENFDLRRKLGENGYNYANNELTWDKKFETVYKRNGFI